MRLLERKSSGEFSLTKELVGKDIPQYAILSHTWGADDEEVTFKDLVEGTGRSKAGYDKIRFCGQQAASDSLQFFWVDTCCIDKSSSTELSEAINSMFRWYHGAAKCYVYLTDVSIPTFDGNIQVSSFTWDLAFRKSRWFTRGWTLQELIAPASVEFFSIQGDRFGDKKSLEQQVHQITDINVRALQGSPLSEFSIKERMSWAQNRRTKREEDKAYSLLGVFDIHMPLIYGEGEKNAFNRLNEEINKSSYQFDKLPRPVFDGLEILLKRLPTASEAPFNSYNRQHEPICLPDTRVDLLQEIYNWADGHDEHIIFWLNGLAGTGKSTIARTLARRWFEQGRLGASFFFSRGGGDVGNARKFFTSIAVQLANNAPPLQRGIYDAITQRNDIAGQSLQDQWHQLVFRPLSNLSGDSCPSSYILVVDALDECADDNNIQEIVRLLAEAQSLKTVRLRVFLTSRPEIPIRYGFYQIPEAGHQDFVLHHIYPSIIDHDIYVYLKYNLKLIGQERSLDAGWPGEQAIKRLVQNASGLFIWAATACRFIREGRKLATKRLALILVGDIGSATAPEKYLNKIYMTVLKQSVSPDNTDEEKEYVFKMLRQILGNTVVLISPLSTKALGGLLHVTKQDVDQTLEDLHAILDIPEDHSRPLRLHHPSFRDFLLDKNRCDDPNFWVDQKQAHQMLANSCIRLLSTALKENICGVDTPGTLAIDVHSSQVERCLPPELQYACLYWIQHLQKSGAQLHDNDHVHQFLQECLLHWLEALGWMQKISDGIMAIISLESIALSSDCHSVYAFIYDMKRFAQHNRLAIEKAPLQIYSSALIFAPVMSIVRTQFMEMPGWMKRSPKVPNNWSALLQTLEGHSGWVNAVAFSPDGKQLASASDDRTVRLWDAATGAGLRTLEGHSGLVNAVAFSPDGKQLASASGDTTVRLWDAATGAGLRTLEGHSGWVNAVAFSPDGKQLASASGDRTVRLWDAATGAGLRTLEGHSGSVRAVAFSPDGKQLASASGDTAVRLWDAATGAGLQTFRAGNLISTLSFSSDRLCIKTDRGWLQVDGTSPVPNLIPPPPLLSLPGPVPPGQVFVKEEWIACGNENILWLPADYRPKCSAVRGEVVVIGHYSGRVSIFEFAFSA